MVITYRESQRNVKIYKVYLLNNRMKTIYFSDDNISDVSIDTAQTCLIKANITPQKEEKIKSLIIAYNLLKTLLKSYGVEVEEVKLKKKGKRKK